MPFYNTPIVTASAATNFTNSLITGLGTLSIDVGSSNRIGNQITLKYIKISAAIYNFADKYSGRIPFRCRYIAVMLKRSLPAEPSDILAGGIR